MRYLTTPVLAACLIAVPAASAWAAGARVELEIVTSPEFSGLEAQSWYRVFEDLKLGSVRIRSGRSTDTVQVAASGSKTAPIYRVTGMLNDRGELVLPGGKFTQRDGAKMAAYFKELQTSGPPGGRKLAAFGLTTEQFDALRKDLARPLKFSTQGKSRAEILEKVAGDLGHEVALQGGVRDSLKDAGDVIEEFQGVAGGTALACLLRPAGLGLMPRPTKGDKVRLEVRSGLTEKDAWPVGMLAEEQRRKLLPALFDFLDVEVPKGTPMMDALAALSGKIGAPILLDHNALAEINLDLTKAKVTVPPSRMTPVALLSKVLAAANPRLRTETRIDENDKPFLWVTIFRVK